MTNSRHTPGPWMPHPADCVWHTGAQRPRVAKFRQMPGAFQIIADARYEITGGASGDEADANARLIAAAPEMLAALRLVAAVPGFEPSEPYGVAVLYALAKVEAVA